MFRCSLILFVLVLCSCGEAHSPAASKSKSKSKSVKVQPPLADAPKQDWPGPTITVSTAKEFIKAVGNDRTILFKPGEYILSSVPDSQMDHIRWDPTTAGKTVTIRNVKNLRLKASGKVRLIVRPYSVFVLNFDNVDNCELDGFILGHAPKKGGCESGVVGMTNCRNVKFLNCDLFGCGTEGLTISKCESISFNKLIIRDCTSGIMTIKGCKQIQFTDSVFKNNEDYWGVQLYDSRSIDFTGCHFENNRSRKPLFNAVSTSAVKISDCKFSGNKVPSRTNKSSAFTNQ